MSDRYLYRALTLLALTFVCISIWGVHATNVIVEPVQFRPAALGFAVILVPLLFGIWRSFHPRLINMLTMLFWADLLGVVHKLPTVIAARLQVPLLDSVLASCDRALGLKVNEVVAWIRQYPNLDWFLIRCYDQLVPMILAAVVIPPLFNQMRRAKEYVLATYVATLIGIVWFALVQALGPWEYYHYSCGVFQDRYVETFHALKTEPVFHFDYSYSDGLVCFPSFHTALAVLAAYALWSIPHVRWPASGLATLIVVSTVTSGTHYLIDVWGGLLVAAVGVWIARGFIRIEARWLERSQQARQAKSCQVEWNVASLAKEQTPS